MSKHTLIAALGFTIGLAVSACVTTSEIDTSHCRYAWGDQTCAARFGEVRPFCTRAACDASSEGFYGCVAHRPEDDCYYPCGDGNDIGADSSCLSGGDMGEADGESEGETRCVDAADCLDPGAPFCELDIGECVGCEGTADPDGACAELDPALAVCHADACVACTEAQAQACVETTPICDAELNVCVGCSDHGQCPDSACNLAVGSCLDPAAVVHVDGDSPDCAAADGTEAAPYCGISEALTDAPDPVLLLIHARDGDAAYQETVLISATVAMFAAPDEEPVVQGFDGAAPVTVGPSGQLFARGLRIAGTPMGEGLAIKGGRAWVEQCKILNNADGGITVDGGGALVLTNSFVGGAQNQRMIDVLDGEVSMVFSTVGAGFGNNARAFACVDGSSSTIRNSVIVSYSEEPELDCPKLVVIDSFTEAEAGVMFDELSGWFVDFEAGDFHLATDIYPTVFETTATWASSDPGVDVDGDPRPEVDGTPEFVGADRIP